MARLFAVGGQLLRLGVHTLLMLALLLVLLLVIGRWLTPPLTHYRDDVATLLSEQWGVPVTIGDLSLTWSGWYPKLHLQQLQLHHPDQQQPLLDFHAAVVTLDPLASLAARRLRPHSIHLLGDTFVLSRDEHGQLRGLPSQDSAQPLTLDALLARGQMLMAVDLSLDTLRWQDNDRELTLHQVRLSLRRRGSVRELDWSAQGPGRSQLRGSLEVQADDAADEPWWLRGYLRVRRLRPGLVDERLAAWPALDTVEVWGHWQADHAQVDVRLDARGTNASLLGVTNQLQGHWRRRSDGWQARLAPPGQAPLLEAVAYDDIQPRLRLRLRDMSLAPLLERLTPWLPIPLQASLTGLQPDGYLDELRLDSRWNGSDYRLSAVVTNPIFTPTSTWPELQASQLRLNLTTWGGRVHLRGPLRLQGDGYPEPALLLGDGDLRWQHRNDASINAHLRLQNLPGQLAVDAVLDPGPAAANLAATVQGRNLDLTHLPTLLPSTIGSPRLRNWLQQALQGGRLAEAKLDYNGSLDGSSPHTLSGWGRIRNATLDYHPDWPALEDFSAEWYLDGLSLSIHARNATLDGHPVPRVKARIDDLTAAILELQGRIKTTAAPLLTSFLATPPGIKQAQRLAILEPSGTTTLDLELVLPLKRNPPGTDTPPQPPVQVATRLTFQDASLALANDLALEQINGSLNIIDGGLQAEDIALRILDQPATLAITTPTEGPPEFRLQGQFPLTAFPGVGDKLAAWSQGSSAWDIRLVPHDDGPDISLTSNLVGTAIRLPGPLAKATDTPRRTTLQLQRRGTMTTVALDQADRLSARLAVSGTPPQLERGEIRVNAGEANLPDASGLQVIARLARFQLPSATTTDNADLPTLPPLLQRADIQIDELLAGGRNWQDIRLDLHQQVEQWSLRIQSPDVSGTVTLPRGAQAAGEAIPTRVQLAHLNLPAPVLNPMPPATSPPMDPRLWPEVQIVVDDLRWQGKPLGTLRLDTRTTDDGLSLDTIDLRSPSFALMGDGRWQRTGTHLNLGFYAARLGAVLAHWQLPDGVRGETQARLEGAWPGPPWRPGLEELQAELTLTLKNGQFPTLEPGVGRLLGLFDIGRLLGRLRLDFRDITNEGFSFDRLDARLQAANGRIQLEQLNLDSPAARVLMEGWLDPLARTLDQTIIVQPRLGASLGVAGTMAGGPLLGLTLMVADRLLDNPVGQVIRHRFRLYGSWDDPQLELSIPEHPPDSGFPSDRP